MTITFGNDNDVIVYALEKIISHARRSQQIFVAQCVWWLASIIGLEQGLVNHIENLRSRSNILLQELAPLPLEKTGTTSSKEKSGKLPEEILGIPRDIQEDLRREEIVSPTIRDIQEGPRSDTGVGNIHPDRIQQVGKETPDLEEEFDSEPDRQSRVLKEADQFLLLSKKDRKAFSKKKAKDQLSRIRSGKAIAKPARPLNNKQWKYLQSISKDTLVSYIIDRK